MKRSTVVGLVMAALILCVAIQVMGSREKPIVHHTAPTPWYVTLDGYDKDAGITVRDINLWKNYNDRNQGVAGTAKHGEKVKYIRRAGDGVLIELSNGTQGWVTYYFIKEFK